MTLPKPLIHFETLLQYEVPFLKWMLSLDPASRSRIINDPTGESCGLEDFASSYSTTYSMTRLSLMYERSGQQCVVVGPRMQAAFANTSLERIPTDMIKLPHPCFYLATPESEDLKLWGGERTQWHPVSGCYVAMEPSEGSNAIIILAWGAANEKSLDPLDDATFWFRLDLDRWAEKEAHLEQEFDTVTSDHHMGNALDAVERESALVRKEMGMTSALREVFSGKRTANLDKALRHLLNSAEGEASDRNMELYKRGQTEAHVEQVKETARKLMRIVINTILYMNSTNAEVSDPVTNDSERARLQARLKGVKNPRKPKGKALQRKLNALPKHRIVWVGPTIEQAVGGEQDFTATGRRSVTGHIRRGHWHTFLVGPRKVEGAAVPKEQRGTTIKWIPPLWVGSVKESSSGSRVYGIVEPKA